MTRVFTSMTREKMCETHSDGPAVNRRPIIQGLIKRSPGAAGGRLLWSDMHSHLYSTILHSVSETFHSFADNKHVKSMRRIYTNNAYTARQKVVISDNPHFHHLLVVRVRSVRDRSRSSLVAS